MSDRGDRSVSRRQVLRITAVAGLGLAFGGVVTREVLRLVGLAEVRLSRRQLGTRVTIAALHPNREAARAMVDDAFATMERLESILSRHRPGTALDRLNASGVLADPPPDLVTVMRRAVEIARSTDGAFDPTIRPVLDLYEGWAREGRTDPPDAGAVEAAVSRVDYREIRVTDERLTLGRPGMGVTLDGIAKGYVVDQTTQALVAGGAERVMVEAGGDVAAGGDSAAGGDPATGGDSPGGFAFREHLGTRPWRLGIQDPRGQDGLLGVVSLAAEGMASSGDYMQSFTADRSLHHIIDPRTGRSPVELAAATVIAPNAMDADALSTAAMVMGPDRALEMFDAFAEVAVSEAAGSGVAGPGVAGLLVTKDGRRISSGGFARYFTPEPA